MYIFGFDPEKVTTSPIFTPRVLAFDHNGNGYMYGQASGAVSQYAFVNIDHEGQIDEQEDDDGEDMGRTMGAAQVALADNEWGWILVFGVGRVEVGASCAANAILYTTTTNGRLDDAAANQKILGIQLTTARGSSAGDAPCLMNFPHSLGDDT